MKFHGPEVIAHGSGRVNGTSRAETPGWCAIALADYHDGVKSGRLPSIRLRTAILIAIGIMTLAACLEHAMGRATICPCGTIRFWGRVNSPENSQQVADWYSFSHIIHGFVLYAAFYLAGRGRWSVGLRLMLAVLVEASWEVLENSPLIINRYRHTMAQGYNGDSIVNSMSDILFCVLGFALARRLPVWATLALVVIMEIGVGYAIRDNLTLNIIMLIHPFESIRRWQMGAG
jgi:hypothetical protein